VDPDDVQALRQHVEDLEIALEHCTEERSSLEEMRQEALYLR
jgi:dihydroorotase